MEITQRHLPHTPWADPALARMPGMRPVEGPWIIVDDAYAAQMAERARLMRDRRASVEAALPRAEPALAELKEVALAALPPTFARTGDRVIAPDGRCVSTAGACFDVLSALLQEDLLILQKEGDEHVLTAGLLCFPAHWTLAEKIGRPLRRIHRPVPEYDGDIAARVQRLFDRVPPGRAMWRANVLAHSTAVLHRPKPEDTPREDRAAARYVRSERQTVLRLPRTGAVLFAVHTYIVALDDLTPQQRAGCPAG